MLENRAHFYFCKKNKLCELISFVNEFIDISWHSLTSVLCRHAVQLHDGCFPRDQQGVAYDR